MTLLDQLKRDEGFKPHAYQDSEGWWTIGYGTLIDHRNGGAIPEDIAELLLKRKSDEWSAWLAETLPWTAELDPVRRAALQNMAYNLGTKLLGFRNALAAIRAGDYAEASKEMLESVWAQQVGPRAHRLAVQIETGVEQ
jgi:lysozyme